ncbi:hypothetical protein GQ457_18G019220 [Hibiscus cannabinus]
MGFQRRRELDNLIGSNPQPQHSPKRDQNVATTNTATNQTQNEDEHGSRVVAQGNTNSSDGGAHDQRPESEGQWLGLDREVKWKETMRAVWCTAGRKAVAEARRDGAGERKMGEVERGEEWLPKN